MRACTSPAEWLIIEGAGPDDFTFACGEHLEDMKIEGYLMVTPVGVDTECCYLYAAEQEGE